MTQKTENIARQQVGLRMHPKRVAELDELCKVNKRSRRGIIEILVREAYGAWQDDPSDRITP